MPDQSTQKPADETVSMAKKFQMKDLGMTEEDIGTIRNNAEADEVIAYIKSKVAAPAEDKKKTAMLKLNANMGHKTEELPPAEDPAKIVQKVFNQTILDKMDPVSPTQPCGRWNNASRIMLIFDEEHPNGRLF